MMTDEKADTWMPLWIGAYLADTMKLTTLQHGAYFLLLIAYWRERKPLADKDDELRSITKLERAEWKRVKPVLAQFFKVGDGVWWHKRVEAEMRAADARSKKASEKAEKAAQARWGDKAKDANSNAPSMLQALPEDVLGECPPPSPIPSSLRSEDSEAIASGDESPPGLVQDEPPDPRDVVFGLGVALLTGAGVKDASARSFLALHCKGGREAEVAAALRACAEAKPVQPIPWLAQRLNKAGKHAGFASKNYREGVTEDGSFT